MKVEETTEAKTETKVEEVSETEEKTDKDEETGGEETGKEEKEKKKRKRKRKQKDKSQQQQPTVPNFEILSDQVMTVLPKLEWKRLRNKYLKFQFIKYQQCYCHKHCV